MKLTMDVRKTTILMKRAPTLLAGILAVEVVQLKECDSDRFLKSTKDGMAVMVMFSSGK